MKRSLAVVVLLAVVFPLPAAARVTESEVADAAAVLEAARARAGEAGARLEAASQEAARLREEIEHTVGALARAQIRLSRAAEAAAEHLVRLYALAAAAGSPLDSLPAASGDRLVRNAYAAAIADRDRAAINDLAVLHDGLEEVEIQLGVLAVAEDETARRLAAAADAAGTELAAAREAYELVAAAWEREEAARRAAAATTTTTTTLVVTTTTDPGTTTTAPTTTSTTTTVPDPDPKGPFPPAVERWRPLVAVYFPPGRVDAALSVMNCESFGDPAITNPSSGAAGLFQHIPRYWPERAAAVGFPDASPYDAEANIAAAAWLVRVSIDSGLAPWYFWVCKP